MSRLVLLCCFVVTFGSAVAFSNNDYCNRTYTDCRNDVREHLGNITDTSNLGALEECRGEYNRCEEGRFRIEKNRKVILRSRFMVALGGAYSFFLLTPRMEKMIIVMDKML